jgi:hypothetical protein
VRCCLLILIVACTPAQRPIVEIAPASSNAPIAVASANDPSPAKKPPARCTSDLLLVQLEPETPTCTVYGLQVGAKGILEGQCNGQGKATARFGLDVVFEGDVTEGHFHLSRTFTTQVGDGCEWRFTETLISMVPTQLAFEYSEEITQAGTKCYRPCGAIGTVSILNQRPL